MIYPLSNIILIPELSSDPAIQGHFQVPQLLTDKKHISWGVKAKSLNSFPSSFIYSQNKLKSWAVAVSSDFVLPHSMEPSL